MKGLSVIQAFGSALVSLAMCVFTAGAQDLPFDQAKERADKGDAFAQAVVAMHYQLGWDTEKDVKQAARYAHASAKANHALGLFRLGVMLRNGEGFAKDDKKGLELQAASYKALKDAKDPYSITATAIMIFQGKVAGQNIDENERRRIAAGLYKQAADMGYAPAQFNYAMALNDGHGVEKNRSSRDVYLMLAAKQNYPLAIDDVKNNNTQIVEFSNEKSKNLSEEVLIVQQTPHSSTDIKAAIKVGDSFVVTAVEGRDIGTTELKVWEARGGKCLYTYQLDNELDEIFPIDNENRFVIISYESKIRKGNWYEFHVDRNSPIVKNIAEPLHRGFTGPQEERSDISGMWCRNYWRIWSASDMKSNGINCRVFSPELQLSSFFTIPSQSLIKIFPDIALSLSDVDGCYIIDKKNTVISLKNGDLGLVIYPNNSGLQYRRINKKSLSLLLPQKVQRSKFFYFEKNMANLAKKKTIYSVPLHRNTADSSHVFAQMAAAAPILIADQTIPSNSPSQVSANRGADKFLISTKDRLIGVDLIGLKTDFLITATKSSAFINPILSPDGKKSYFALADNETDWKNRKSDLPFRKELEKECARGNSEIGLRNIFCVGWKNQGIGNRLLENFVWQGFSSDRNLGIFSSIHELVAVSLNQGEILYRTPVPAQMWYGKPPNRVGNFHASWHASAFYIAYVSYLTDSSLILLRAEPLSHDLIEVKKINNAGESKFRFDGTSAFCNLDISNSRNILAPINSKWGGDGLGFTLNSDQEITLSGACRTNWIDEKIYFVGKRDRLEVKMWPNAKIAEWPDSVVSGHSTAKWEGLDPWDFDPISSTFAHASTGGYLSLIKFDGKLLKEYLRIFFANDGGSIFVTPDNYYTTRSLMNTNVVAFTKGSRSYPFEQFDLRLNRPDIVLERLGAPSEAISIARQMREKRLKRMNVTEEMLRPDFHLPELEIVGGLPSTTDAETISISIKGQDAKYKLERLKVYVNNVPVNGRDGESLRELDTQSIDRAIPIKLAAGRNKIQISILNSAGAESLYASAEVNCTAKRPKPTLYAVALGVSHYANPEWNLKYSAKDATDIIARLKGKVANSHEQVKELLLTDKDVTRENLTKIREFLKSAKIDDTVLIFVAGHGLLDSKYDYYFGTTDIDFNNPAEKGIAFDDFDDLLAELPTLKKSLLIDTCHAGELDEEEKTLLASAQGESIRVPTKEGISMRSIGVRGMSVKKIEGGKGAAEWHDRLQGLFVDLRRGSGSTILSSAAGAEYALESSEQQNGLFTYAVLEALEGKGGSDANKDGLIQMTEISEYVKKRVSELSGNKQTPNIRRMNLEGDFALTTTK